VLSPGVAAAAGSRGSKLLSPMALPMIVETPSTSPPPDVQLSPRGMLGVRHALIRVDYDTENFVRMSKDVTDEAFAQIAGPFVAMLVPGTGGGTTAGGAATSGAAAPLSPRRSPQLRPSALSVQLVMLSSVGLCALLVSVSSSSGLSLAKAFGCPGIRRQHHGTALDS
jgi:hypothetical protein